MLRNVLRRPSPATVIALLALVVLAAPLANAAQEAVQNPTASSAQKKKAKKVERARFADKAKFADNAGKVRGYSVGFAALPSRVVLTGPNGRLPAAVIPTGVPGISTGPTGARGPAGSAGPAGPAGATGPAGGFARTELRFTIGELSGSGLATAEAACLAGERVAGGGHEVLLPARTGSVLPGGEPERAPVEVLQSIPKAITSSTSGWFVQIARVPSEVRFVDDGAGGVKARPLTDGEVSAEKVVRVKAWAVCVSR